MRLWGNDQGIVLLLRKIAALLGSAYYFLHGGGKFEVIVLQIHDLPSTLAVFTARLLFIYFTLVRQPPLFLFEKAQIANSDSHHLVFTAVRNAS